MKHRNEWPSNFSFVVQSDLCLFPLTISCDLKRKHLVGSVSFGSVRLTEPCRQVRIRFGSVGKFRIRSEPS